MNEVGVCSPDRVVYEGCDRAQAISFIAVIEELAQFCAEGLLRRAYLSPRPCQTISGKLGSFASMLADGLEPRGLWRMSEGDAICRRLRTKAKSVLGSFMILVTVYVVDDTQENSVTMINESGCLIPDAGRKSRACPLRMTSLSINPCSTLRPSRVPIYLLYEH